MRRPTHLLVRNLEITGLNPQSAQAAATTIAESLTNDVTFNSGGPDLSARGELCIHAWHLPPASKSTKVDIV